MKTIEERARLNLQYEKDFLGRNLSDDMVCRAYIKGATEQKAIDDDNLQERFQKVIIGRKWHLIDKACYAFCHTGCPHKTDSYNCFKDKCETWEIFRRMMEE